MLRITSVGYITLLAAFLSASVHGQVTAKDGAKQVASAEPVAVTLTASDGKANNEFGYSVAISGNTIVVGSPYATVAGHYAQGAVYVFRQSAEGAWSTHQIAKLTASDGNINAFFGSSIAISGDTVVVGADGADIGSQMSQGAAYVFVKPAGGWANMTQTIKLTTSDGNANSYFGSSVALQDDMIAIGADGAKVGSNGFAGAVYLFAKPSKGWGTTHQPSAKLIASDGSKDDQLGYSVAISADVVVAGARSATVGANSRQGAAYLFMKPASGWKNLNETAKLTASDGSKEAQFGYSVGIDGDTAVVGAPGKDSPGAVYLFVKPAVGWATTMAWNSKLTASDGVNGDQFGYAVSIDGDTVLAGAPTSKVLTNANQGTVYQFSRPSNGWNGKITQTLKLTSPSGKPEDRFGSTIHLNANTWVLGSPYATVGVNHYQGAVSVFPNVHAVSSTR